MKSSQTQKELVSKILEASENINRSARRGYGEFIITKDMFMPISHKISRKEKIEELLNEIDK